MYTMRRSTDADIPRERELWRMSFGDDWDYIDTYYDHTHDPDWCVVLEDEDGVVQTMLIGFPVQQTLPDGRHSRPFITTPSAPTRPCAAAGTGGRCSATQRRHFQTRGGRS